MTGWLSSSVVVFARSAKGPGFEPWSSQKFSPVTNGSQRGLAQSVEHETLNLGGVGSCLTLGSICNRWKIVARTQDLSLTVRTLYHWATEPPSHITNNSPPETVTEPFSDPHSNILKNNTLKKLSNAERLIFLNLILCYKKNHALIIPNIYKHVKMIKI